MEVVQKCRFWLKIYELDITIQLIKDTCFFNYSAPKKGLNPKTVVTPVALSKKIVKTAEASTFLACGW